MAYTFFRRRIQSTSASESGRHSARTASHPTPSSSPATPSNLDASDPRPGSLAVAGFYLALAIIAGIAFSTFVSIHGFVDRAKRVEHSHQVRLAIEELRTEYGKARMYWRMFIMGSEPEHERGFASASSALASRLDALKLLTADNTAQQVRLNRLDHLVRTDLDELGESIEARRNGRFATTAALVSEMAARTLQLDQIDATAREMLDVESRLLEQRAAETAASGFRTTALIGVGSTAAGGLLLAAFVVLRREVYQRRRAELDSRRAALEIEDLYNSAPCGYHSLDATGTFVRINDTELGWLGYAREEMLGKMRFADILTPESRQTFSENFPHFIASGKAVDFEFDLLRKDGSVLPVSVSASAIFDDDGNYLMSRSSMFDMTRRREAEAERDRFFALALDMLCVGGMDGYFRRVNPAFSETLGYSAQDLLSKPFLEFVHQDDRAATLEELENLRRGEPTIQFENRYRCRDGSWKWLSWKVQPFMEDALFYATARDVTLRRQMDEQIRALNRNLEARTRELEETNKELESFSYSVSHDLRGPLRAIDGFSRILQEDFGDRLDDEGRRLITVVRDSTQKMGTLIDDLLAFSRLGRKPIARETVDMNAMVESLLAQLRQQTGLAPEIVLSDLGRAKCDSALIRQVWVNLLANALKFSSAKPGARIEVGRLAPEQGFITWYVRDNGAGFDMKYADKLFGVFQRLHSESEFPGTGVGLAIVQRVVTRHGGRVWAEARAGEGATFFFTIPEEASDERT